MGGLQAQAITENMFMNIERLQVWVGDIKLRLGSERCKVIYLGWKFTDNQGNGATILGK